MKMRKKKKNKEINAIIESIKFSYLIIVYDIIDIVEKESYLYSPYEDDFIEEACIN